MLVIMKKGRTSEAATLSQIAGELPIASKEPARHYDIKKIRELKMKTKICILSNYPYPQYKNKCFEAGADYLLSKTEDFEDILIVITEYVNEKLKLLTEFSCNLEYEDHEEKQHIGKSK
jgi:DNA-binding NarL/FixJ family response regulator